jgi:ribosomal-protein-alanine N-acetyltransferase
MFELQRLSPDHEPAILEFERANRAYFAESITDRGDDFFEHFAERHSAMLIEQEDGRGAFFVRIEEGGTVVGRFNLYDIVDGTAQVGYRVAQRVAGRGVATAGLRDLCRIATEECGLRLLKAAASDANIASQRVLSNAGFAVIGPAEVEGRHGVLYELVLGQP